MSSIRCWIVASTFLTLTDFMRSRGFSYVRIGRIGTDCSLKRFQIWTDFTAAPSANEQMTIIHIVKDRTARIPTPSVYRGEPLFQGPDAPAYDNLMACVKCGLCLSVCPTYATDAVEIQSPRGRVQLMLAVEQGQIPLADPVVEHLYHCLDCRACETVCPSEVRVGEQVLLMRGLAEGERPRHWLARLILEQLMTHPERLELAAWPLRLYQWLGIQWLVRKSGVLRLLPKALQSMERLLPTLPRTPLRRALPEVTPAVGARSYRVGFFLGCVMSLVFAKTSARTVRVLAENGCEVVLPKAQKCCGAPHAGEGDIATLKHLARHNVDLFAGYELDYIVADCAACSAQTKEYAQLLDDDPAYAERARAFAAKVRDVTEFLAEIPLREPAAEVRRKVTYHEACHLCHVQGITQEPRRVLGVIPGVELAEMREASWCCGSAGIYNLTHVERADQILDRKLDNIASTGADTVATANPGCLLQLMAGVRERGMAVDVVHPVDLLAESYGADRA
ncbi:MAG: 4Fe-4S dicluster domain-containing protein [Chloroflexi bacterium]|nr:4Fe-4S dicluster domain-containing protein [Chloroflexota bacterium]